MSQRQHEAEGLYREVARSYAINANNVRGLAVRESVLAKDMRREAAEMLVKAEDLKRLPVLGTMLAKVVVASANANLRDAGVMAEKSRLLRANARQIIEQGRQALDESYRLRARTIE